MLVTWKLSHHIVELVTYTCLYQWQEASDQ